MVKLVVFFFKEVHRQYQSSPREQWGWIFSKGLTSTAKLILSIFLHFWYFYRQINPYRYTLIINGFWLLIYENLNHNDQNTQSHSLVSVSPTHCSSYQDFSFLLFFSPFSSFASLTILRKNQKNPQSFKRTVRW